MQQQPLQIQVPVNIFENRKLAAALAFRESLAPFFVNRGNKLNLVIIEALHEDILGNVDLNMTVADMKVYIDGIFPDIFNNPNEYPDISVNQFNDARGHFLEYVRASRGLNPEQINNNAMIIGGRRRRSKKSTRRRLTKSRRTRRHRYKH